jgi:hypothetical protein
MGHWSTSDAHLVTPMGTGMGTHPAANRISEGNEGTSLLDWETFSSVGGWTLCGEIEPLLKSRVKEARLRIAPGESVAP